jgi:uncharacterized membrane protein YecN with MAPEG domain
MQSVMVLAPYAAVLAGLMVGLSMRVSLARLRTGVSLGVGSDADLLERVRIFGNFAEWVPMALGLLVLAALTGMPTAWLHGLGATLVLARVLHPFGMSAVRSVTLMRFLGTAATYGVILVAAGWLILAFLAAVGGA